MKGVPPEQTARSHLVLCLRNESLRGRRKNPPLRRGSHPRGLGSEWFVRGLLPPFGSFIHAAGRRVRVRLVPPSARGGWAGVHGSHRQRRPPSRALVRPNAHTSRLDLGAMYASTTRTTNGAATRPSTTTPPRQGRTGLERVARDAEPRRRSLQANRPQRRPVSPRTGHAARRRPPVPGWRRRGGGRPAARLGPSRYARACHPARRTARALPSASADARRQDGSTRLPLVAVQEASASAACGGAHRTTRPRRSGSPLVCLLRHETIASAPDRRRSHRQRSAVRTGQLRAFVCPVQLHEEHVAAADVPAPSTPDRAAASGAE